MPALRILGGICVAAAGVLAVATLISQPPPSSSHGAGPAPQVEFLWSVPGPTTTNPANLRPQIADNSSETGSAVAPVHHSRKHHAVSNEHQSAAEHHRSKHRHRHGEQAPVSTLSASDSFPAPVAPARAVKLNELTAVKQRLRDGLNSELYRDFQLFLYVSKAASGPLAQRMYVFRKNANNDLALLYDWPVSTGRERVEHNDRGVQLSSFTPTGYYKLDPKRFYRRHTSAEWRQQMPFAMFFDWVQRGTPTGLAIHAATGSDIAALGTRASAGCVRLAPDAAQRLFTLVRRQYRGLAPRFAVDHRTGTMSNDGIVLHDAKGDAQLTEGYKVLVVIENYGGANLVAAMY